MEWLCICISCGTMQVGDLATQCPNCRGTAFLTHSDPGLIDMARKRGLNPPEENDEYVPDKKRKVKKKR